MEMLLASLPLQNKGIFFLSSPILPTLLSHHPTHPYTATAMMGLRSIHLRSTLPPSFSCDSFIEKSAYSAVPSPAASFLGIAPGKRSCCCVRVRAMAKRNPGNSNSNSNSSSGNGDRSVPNGDGSKGHDTPKSKPQRITLDSWREYRATLWAREQAEAAEPEHEGAQLDHTSRGQKWAHPIALPEPGSVLIATETLDKCEMFGRTVIFLLSDGTKNPQDQPTGIVINRPLHRKIKHMKPSHLDLAATFADSALHIGGPLLESSICLFRSGDDRKFTGFEEVIPGLCYGTKQSLDEAMTLVKKGVAKPQDFRFFRGFAGWGRDQLKQELDKNYWHVAACSANLIFGDYNQSPEGLWEEILQLMGGQYAELSRKPKLDI